MTARRWVEAGILAAGVACLAGTAQAQMCHHHHHGLGMPNPGGLNPQLLQTLLQQQYLEQQQLLQVAQQQMLQAKVLEDRVRELAGKPTEVIQRALKAQQPEERWAAALVVGEGVPDLADDLVELLTDTNPYVRQAARQGLVRTTTRVPTADGKPGKGRKLDFGPAPTAGPAAQRTAANKWRSWLESQKRKVLTAQAAVAAETPAGASGPVEASSPAPSEESATQLGNELVQASADQRMAVLEKLRDRKGTVYTEVLARSIPQLAGEDRKAARRALADRMVRMTSNTLREKLRDEDAEVRRAAALACAMKDLRPMIPDLIALLEDPAAAVPPAARVALRSLTDQDFGAITPGDRDGQTRVAAAWKAWWQQQSSR